MNVLLVGIPVEATARLAEGTLGATSNRVDRSGCRNDASLKKGQAHAQVARDSSSQSQKSEPTPSMRSTPGHCSPLCPGVSSRWLPVLDGRQTISVVAAAVGSGRDGDVEVQVEVDSANVDHHAAIADVQGRRLRG